MTEIAFLKFAHVLGLVYWLGADLGTWYSSYFAIDKKLPAGTRVVIIRILLALDLSPRICMTLMLPLGIHLAWRLRLLSLDAASIGIMWVICLTWLSMVLYLHVSAPGASKQLLTRLDWHFRLLVIIGLVAYGAYLMASTGSGRFLWLSYKLLIYAAMVACGLVIRRLMRPFGSAFGRLAQNAASPQDDEAIRSSLQACRPFVLIIWAGLLTSTALGLHAI